MYKFSSFIAAAACIFIIGINSQTTKLVRPFCMGCMCQALTNCSRDYNGGYVIGLMRISPGYWSDAGERLIGNFNLTFEQCAKHSRCATLAVENYMNRYKQDCNEDGRIDCIDFSMIHLFGPGGCTNRTVTNNTLPEWYLKTFKPCLTCQYGVALEFEEYSET